MQVEFHVGVHRTGAPLFQHNLTHNRRRLLRNGVILANRAFPELLKSQMWAMRRMDRADPPVLPDMNTLREQNGNVLKEAQERGAHTLLISHESRMGYAPYVKFGQSGAPVQFYPNAHHILPGMLSGFPPERVTVHLHTKRFENLVPELWLEGLRINALSCTLDEFIDRLDLETFSFSVLHDRLRASLPGVRFRLRSVDGEEADPDAFLAMKMRDVGIDPLSMKRDTSVIVRPDKDQVRDIAALVASWRDGDKDAMREMLPDPLWEAPEIELSGPVRQRLQQLSERDARRFIACNPVQPLTIFFMVAPGPLELQAHLLVASLKVNCQDDARLIAFCRDDQIDLLHRETVEFLDLNDVELRALTNDFEDSYPAGNKLIAASMVPGDGWSVFLDTDMMMVRPGRFMEETVPGRISACLDTVNAWSTDPSDWAVLYDGLGAEPPAFDVHLIDGGRSHPMFNAGMILFPPADQGQPHFGRIWHDVARRIDANPDVIRKRPWLDTIALAATPWLKGSPGVRILDSSWNCPPRHANADTRILHYHGVRQLGIFNWHPVVNDILSRSRSSFDSINRAIHHFANEMKVGGDVRRRAMRHGLMETRDARQSRDRDK